MENRKGNDIFLGVVGVATLLVAIVGATFAWFSASVRGENAVNVSSTTLELGFDDDTENLSTLLIPTAENYALYSATNAAWINKSQIQTGTDPETQAPIYTTGKGLCTDDNGNIICGVYDFTIGNPNTTTMDVTAEVISTVNEFAEGHMKFAIYELNSDSTVGDKVGDTLPFASLTSDGGEATVEVPAFEYTLLGSKTAVSVEDKDDFSKYTTINDDPQGRSNVMNFRMVIFLEEANEDQTDADSGKFLTAAIKINTLSGAGVTGVIAAAEASA